MHCLRTALADLLATHDADTDKEQQLYSPSDASRGRLVAASGATHALALPGAGWLMLWGGDQAQPDWQGGHMPLPEPDLADAPPAYAELRFT